MPAWLASLTTEYLAAPLGVDVLPRFSWHVQADLGASGLQQAAYRLQVSSDGYETLSWDTGRVGGQPPTLLQYNGTTLRSSTAYVWRVMAWLTDGSSTPYASSTFGTGLLDHSDWQATWITGGNTRRLLRKEFTLGALAAGATLFIAGIGYSEIALNGKPVSADRLGPWSDFSRRTLPGLEPWLSDSEAVESNHRSSASCDTGVLYS
eukprot:1068158-Prymnesium_polylepis.1